MDNGSLPAGNPHSQNKCTSDFQEYERVNEALEGPVLDRIFTLSVTLKQYQTAAQYLFVGMQHQKFTGCLPLKCKIN